MASTRPAQVSHCSRTGAAGAPVRLRDHRARARRRGAQTGWRTASSLAPSRRRWGFHGQACTTIFTPAAARIAADRSPTQRPCVAPRAQRAGRPPRVRGPARGCDPRSAIGAASADARLPTMNGPRRVRAPVTGRPRARDGRAPQWSAICTGATAPRGTRRCSTPECSCATGAGAMTPRWRRWRPSGFRMVAPPSRRTCWVRPGRDRIR
jgi:hypothetical protein